MGKVERWSSFESVPWRAPASPGPLRLCASQASFEDARWRRRGGDGPANAKLFGRHPKPGTYRFTTVPKSSSISNAAFFPVIIEKTNASVRQTTKNCASLDIYFLGSPFPEKMHHFLPCLLSRGGLTWVDIFWPCPARLFGQSFQSAKLFGGFYPGCRVDHGQGNQTKRNGHPVNIPGIFLCRQYTTFRDLGRRLGGRGSGPLLVSRQW